MSTPKLNKNTAKLKEQLDNPDLKVIVVPLTA